VMLLNSELVRRVKLHLNSVFPAIVKDYPKAYDTSESFLAKVTFERKLSYVAYTLAQVFTCESQLSEIERVLFLKVFFRTL